MRIAVDMHFLQDKHQGIKTCLTGLYEEVCRLNSAHSFLFLFSHADETTMKWGEYGDVAYIGTESRARRLGYKMARTIAKAGHVDLSHFSAVVPGFVPGKILLTIHDLLFISHPQFFPPHYRWQQRLALRWSLKSAHAITAVSEYTASSITQRFPDLQTPVEVIPNGINFEPDPPQRSAAQEFVGNNFGVRDYFLIVGRIDPRKNHKNMIRAYRELAKTVDKSILPALVIVGNVDNNFSEGAELIEDAQKELPVYWLRDVSDKALRMLYSASLCVISASFGEGFGLPLLEAMSYGTSIIGSDNTAVPEVTEDCGILVDPEHPKSIMNAMFRVINDSKLRSEMRQRGLAIAGKKTWRNSAKQFLALLDTL